MRTYELVIQGHCPSKKTSQAILMNKATGKRFISKPQRARDYEEPAVAQLHDQWKVHGRRRPALCHDVLCSLKVYYYAAKGLGRRADAHGPGETIYDVLQAAGVITNDVHLVPGGVVDPETMKRLGVGWVAFGNEPMITYRTTERIPVRDRNLERVEITLVDLEENECE